MLALAFQIVGALFIGYFIFMGIVWLINLIGE